MVFIHDFTQITQIPTRSRRAAALLKRTACGNKVCGTDGGSDPAQKAVQLSIYDLLSGSEPGSGQPNVP